MKCTNCGAHLTDEDLFCPRCGTKVVRDKRCPNCGAVLREDIQFCNKCGAPVDGEKGQPEAPRETLDIPIDAIERNILTETAAEIRSDRREIRPDHKEIRSDPKEKRSGKSLPPSGSGASASHKDPAHPDRYEGAVKKKETRRREDWDEKDPEEEDWEEEDWEEEDWDDEDEDEGIDVITVMTAVVGCVILVVMVILGYRLYRQYAPGNYENGAEEVQTQEDQAGQDAAEDEGGNAEEEESKSAGGEESTLTVIHNVNVRDNPSTSDSNILKVAQEGETYRCTGSVDGGEWYKIILDDGSTGYVFHEYVTVE